ncbi:MAG: Fic family protein [Gammaproteobacteria bacterium]|nr:Fic family protein [Gammaproteobacteria bacterium]
MDWHDFRFEYRVELDEPGRDDLTRIEGYREAAGNLVLPPHWSDQLDRLNRIRAVHGTTALEGNPLSEAEVEHQMELMEEPQAGPEHPSREQRQVRNAGRGQDWIKKRFAPGRAPLAQTDIPRLHQLVTEGSDETENLPGRLRRHSVVVGTPQLGGVQRGAPHEELPRLLEEFVGFVNSRRLAARHPVIQALVAHFFLVTIHPFGDGNGRVSRLVEAGMLYKEGYNVHGFYGLSNFFYRHADEYRLLLQQSRRVQPFDLNAFVAFGLRGFAEELKGINNFIKAKLNRVIYRDTLVRALNQRVGARRRVLNQREYQLLDFLLTETEPIDPFADEPSRKIGYAELRQSPYITAVYRDVTARTFFRELVRLEEMGFVKFVREGTEPVVELDFGAIGRY